MSTTNDPDLNETLRAIEQAYRENLPERLRAIGACLRRCVEEPGEDSHAEQLLAKLHGLSGSAGTFGFSELGMRATELEILLGDFLASAASANRDFASLAVPLEEFLRWAEAHVKGRSNAV